MDIGNFAPYLSAIEIILSIAVTALVLVTSKGSDLGGFLGGGGTDQFRTRRGLEASMFRVTIGTFIAFFIFTILTFISLGQAG
ncbi:MAG TPA: preprotein translocase subunit SecG [Anaerolineae bacterium]|nr:preprotein translocase subunit SecG [Anaerolineae bacterium]